MSWGNFGGNRRLWNLEDETDFPVPTGRGSPVANIEPGKEIDVTIKYFHTLGYVDGWYDFVFPLVVGPRFNPPGSG